MSKNKFVSAPIKADTAVPVTTQVEATAQSETELMDAVAEATTEAPVTTDGSDTAAVESSVAEAPVAVEVETPATQEEEQKEEVSAPAAAAVIPEQVLAEGVHHATLLLAKKYPNNPVSPAVSNIITRMDEYVANMAPSQPVAPVDGARRQVGMLRAILAALEIPGVDGVMAIDVVVSYFRHYRDDAFNEMYVMRFMEHANIEKKQKFLMQMLFVLFATFARDNGHQAVKRSIDFKQIQKNMSSTIAFERLLSYFHKG